MCFSISEFVAKLCQLQAKWILVSLNDYFVLVYLTKNNLLIAEDSFYAEDIPEESWNQLSQSESEYEPSQQESRDSEQVGIFFLL